MTPSALAASGGSPALSSKPLGGRGSDVEALVAKMDRTMAGCHKLQEDVQQLDLHIRSVEVRTRSAVDAAAGLADAAQDVTELKGQLAWVCSEVQRLASPRGASPHVALGSDSESRLRQLDRDVGGLQAEVKKSVETLSDFGTRSDSFHAEVQAMIAEVQAGFREVPKQVGVATDILQAEASQYLLQVQRKLDSCASAVSAEVQAATLAKLDQALLGVEERLGEVEQAQQQAQQQVTAECGASRADAERLAQVFQELQTRGEARQREVRGDIEEMQGKISGVPQQLKGATESLQAQAQRYLVQLQEKLDGCVGSVSTDAQTLLRDSVRSMGEELSEQAQAIREHAQMMLNDGLRGVGERLGELEQTQRRLVTDCGASRVDIERLSKGLQELDGRSGTLQLEMRHLVQEYPQQSEGFRLEVERVSAQVQKESLQRMLASERMDDLEGRLSGLQATALEKAGDTASLKVAQAEVKKHEEALLQLGGSTRALQAETRAELDGLIRRLDGLEDRSAAQSQACGKLEDTPRQLDSYVRSLQAETQQQMAQLRQSMESSVEAAQLQARSSLREALQAQEDTVMQLGGALREGLQGLDGQLSQRAQAQEDALAQLAKRVEDTSLEDVVELLGQSRMDEQAMERRLEALKQEVKKDSDEVARQVESSFAMFLAAFESQLEEEAQSSASTPVDAPQAQWQTPLLQQAAAALSRPASTRTEEAGSAAVEAGSCSGLPGWEPQLQNLHERLRAQRARMQQQLDWLQQGLESCAGSQRETAEAVRDSLRAVGDKLQEHSLEAQRQFEQLQEAHTQQDLEQYRQRLDKDVAQATLWREELDGCLRAHSEEVSKQFEQLQQHLDTQLRLVCGNASEGGSETEQRQALAALLAVRVLGGRMKEGSAQSSPRRQNSQSPRGLRRQLTPRSPMQSWMPSADHHAQHASIRQLVAAALRGPEAPEDASKLAEAGRAADRAAAAEAATKAGSPPQLQEMQQQLDGQLEQMRPQQLIADSVASPTSTLLPGTICIGPPGAQEVRQLGSPASDPGRVSADVRRALHAWQRDSQEELMPEPMATLRDLSPGPVATLPGSAGLRLTHWQRPQEPAAWRPASPRSHPTVASPGVASSEVRGSLGLLQQESPSLRQAGSHFGSPMLQEKEELTRNITFGAGAGTVGAAGGGLLTGASSPRLK